MASSHVLAAALRLGAGRCSVFSWFASPCSAAAACVVFEVAPALAAAFAGFFALAFFLGATGSPSYLSAARFAACFAAAFTYTHEPS